MNFETVRELAKEVWNQYKPNIFQIQKTHENLFVLGFEACMVKYFYKINIPKIVIYKDGSWILCKDGITWEYEVDKDYLITICISDFI